MTINRALASVGGMITGIGLGYTILGGMVHMTRKERLISLLMAFVGVLMVVVAVLAEV